MRHFLKKGEVWKGLCILCKEPIEGNPNRKWCDRCKRIALEDLTGIKTNEVR